MLTTRETRALLRAAFPGARLFYTNKVTGKPELRRVAVAVYAPTWTAVAYKLRLRVERLPGRGAAEYRYTVSRRLKGHTGPDVLLAGGTYYTLQDAQTMAENQAIIHADDEGERQ